MSKLALLKKINLSLVIISIIISIILIIIINKVNPNDIDIQNKLIFFVKAYLGLAMIIICIMNILIIKAKKKL